MNAILSQISHEIRRNEGISIHFEGINTENEGIKIRFEGINEK